MLKIRAMGSWKRTAVLTGSLRAWNDVTVRVTGLG